MAKIIITGNRGQLGRALEDAFLGRPEHNITGVDIDELNITDATSVEDFFSSSHPDFIINCAAYTAVDKAEEESEKAFSINGHGVKNLAVAASAAGSRLIHISTDYVFDGHGCTPYKEDHPANPLSVYGQSKLEGEVAALYHAPGTIIIRTSWLYYFGGKNFVNTIVERATIKKHLQVVSDQVGAPTYAGDLAAAIVKIVEKPINDGRPNIYHYSNSGAASWYDFARAITTILNIECAVDPIPTSSLNQPAPRPSYSLMDCNLIRREYDVIQPWWIDSLRNYLNNQLFSNNYQQ